MKSLYIELLSQYNVNKQDTSALWHELENHYSKSNRHYHNLKHLADVYGQLLPLKEQIENWNVLMFSLFYHDIIYNVRKSDNEEQSAKRAEERMQQIGISKDDVALCSAQIIATKTHTLSTNQDTNFFTDADLSILGRDNLAYQQYCENIRKEYSIYPDFLYKKGRKKVILHFLNMDKIFKTDVFFDLYEKQARLNLENELTI